MAWAKRLGKGLGSKVIKDAKCSESIKLMLSPLEPKALMTQSPLKSEPKGPTRGSRSWQVDLVPLQSLRDAWVLR